VRDPETIGVIPDGNRRYARRMGISLQEGYLRGIRKAEELMDYVVESTKTKNVYFYTLSLENLRKRSQLELSFLFKAFEREAKRVLLDNRWNARIRFMGRLGELPRNILKTAQEVEKRTENNNGPTIILAMAYTGIAEVVDMVKAVAAKVKEGALRVDDIDENVIFSHLYVPDIPFPDLIVRTSGERRTSGFLPIQSVYSELLFYPKLWPEIERADLERIYEDFRGRERRFGR